MLLDRMPRLRGRPRHRPPAWSPTAATTTTSTAACSGNAAPNPWSRAAEQATAPASTLATVGELIEL